MIQVKAHNIIVIGAGPAGLAAAIAAKEAGVGKILIIERDNHPGGILQQCIHVGFGLGYFGEELTGPEYAERFYTKAQECGIEILLDTMVLDIQDKTIYAVNTKDGIVGIEAKAIILAMGCRERTRGAIKIPGTRAAGIYNAGTAQRLLNVNGEMIGKTIIILGSGDIGMIMARRMTLEGAEVKAVVELLPYLTGLTRNKVQCLDDFGIPLKLGHTIIDISGVNRVESVTICKLDCNRMPIKGEEEVIECDTVLLSVGLIPENELSRTVEVELSDITKGPVVDQCMQTTKEGIFACGNVLHVNDLVDNVSKESETAGKNAALYVLGKPVNGLYNYTVPGEGVSYICPQRLRREAGGAKLFFRVQKPMGKVEVKVSSGGKLLSSHKLMRVSPGEMEKAVLSDEIIRNLQADVMIEVKEETPL